MLSTIIKNAERLARDYSGDSDLTAELYLHFTQKFAELTQEKLEQEGTDSWEKRIVLAQQDYQRWDSRGTAWKNAEAIAKARLGLEITPYFYKQYKPALILIDGLHQGIISNALETNGLLEKMKSEGNSGRKLVIDELSPYLSPIFKEHDGISCFYMGSTHPYGYEIRFKLLGQIKAEKTVSGDQVVNSVMNLKQIPEAYYVLSETSAGPTNKIPASGGPRTFISSGVGKERIGYIEYSIDTSIRQFFNASIRELLFKTLMEMYEITTEIKT